MRYKACFRPRNALALAATLALLGCDYANDLGYGYQYVMPSGYAVIFRGEMDQVVAEDVTRYKVLGPYVIGERNLPTTDFERPPDNRYGFFVLDMKTERVSAGLSDEGLSHVLEAKALVRAFDATSWTNE